MKLFSIALFIVATHSQAMDISKIPVTTEWTKKRIAIIALLDRHCKLTLPNEPQGSATQNLKKQIGTRAKL